MQSHYQIKTLAEKLINKHFFFDSRICTKNSAFVALETGNRSGMEFIQNAISNGADCVISQQTINVDGIENIVVPDSLEFIQNLANNKFEILKNRGIKTVCLTGSAGKTTTKELIANTLMQYGTVYATQGNYNNHIGVPITILNCPTNVDFLVLEMGMNHAGEIAKLVEIAPCDFRLITNVGNAHTANFHNGITGVLHAKFEILQNGNPKVFILEDLYNKFLLDKTLQGMYGSSDIAVVKPDFAKFYENETTKFAFKGMNFSLAGIYSDSQIAMFCLATELISSVIGKQIQNIVLPELKGRSNVVLWRNIKIINDSYNANPLSMVNSLENLKQYKGKKLCILGEMRELGSDSKAFHKNLEGILGAFAGVYLIGNNFEDVKPDVNELQLFDNYVKLKEFLLSNVENVLQYDVILVKGSNGVLLWKLFDEVFCTI